MTATIRYYRVFFVFLSSLILGGILFLFLLPIVSSAQITLDGTLGPKGPLAGPDYTIDAKELGLLGGQVDLENKSIEEVAEAWVNANEAKWRAWAAATN